MTRPHIIFLVLAAVCLLSGCDQSAVGYSTPSPQEDTGSDTRSGEDEAVDTGLPDVPGADAACTEECGGGYACIDGEIVACDDTAPCGQCACDTVIDVAACPQGCTEGERADRVGDLCHCACEDDSDCPPGESCRACACIEIPLASCESLCAAREEGLGESGNCDFEYRSEVPCGAFCEDLRARFSPQTAAAFTLCIESDPLCFSDIEDCLFGVLYQGGVEVPITLTASGFDEYNGRSVYGVIEDGNQPVARTGPITIGDGGWTMAFNHITIPAPEETVYLYIDVDGDGRCDAEVDVAIFARTQRGDDYENPAYQGTLEPDGRSHDFVCDLIN